MLVLGSELLDEQPIVFLRVSATPHSTVSLSSDVSAAPVGVIPVVNSAREPFSESSADETVMESTRRLRLDWRASPTASSRPMGPAACEISPRTEYPATAASMKDDIFMERNCGECN